MQPEEQSQSQQQQAQTQPENDSMTESKSIPDSGAIFCPECGGTRVRTRSSFVWFLVAIAGMLAVLSGQNVFVQLPLKRYMLILSYIWMFVLCAACVFVWMLLFRNSLCKNCGHRFPTKLGTRKEQDKTAFPFRFSVLNSLLFLLGAITSASMLEVLLYVGISYFLYRAVVIGIACVLFTAFSVPYHIIVYFLVRKVIKNQFLWAILFVMPPFMLSGDVPYHSLPRVHAARILSYGRLADLPESATDLKVYSWSSLFSGHWYLRFQASPEDIEKFVNDSPSIKGQECIIYSPEKMKIPLTRDKEKMEELRKAGHEIYFKHSLAPKWYRPDIRIRGREYGIPPVEHHNNGEVIVDDEKNVVYIKIIWS